MRNLVNTIKHYKIASILNILGLSVAFATFTILMMQTHWEYSFGTTDQSWENIYRIDNYSEAEKSYSPTNNAAVMLSLIENEPQVEAIAQFLKFPNKVTITRPTGENEVFNNIHTLQTNGDLSKVFDIDMVVGNAWAITEPNKCIISDVFAHKLFGDENPVGKVITEEHMRTPTTIEGVYRSFADNATLSGVEMIMHRDLFKHSALYCWNYIKLKDGSDAETLAKKFSQKELMMPWKTKEKQQFRLLNLNDIYFDTAANPTTLSKQGDKASTDILSAVAVLVLVIAFINFLNFYTALAPVRVRSLNTRTVFGSPLGALRRGIIAEGVVISALAYTVSLLLVYSFDFTPLASYMNMESTALDDNIAVIVACGVIAIIGGAAAGIYPAHFCTSFNTALVLKGSPLAFGRGKWLRQTLISLQYVISIGLIIFAIVVRQQHTAMLNAPLGFNKANLVTLKLPSNEVVPQIAEQLKSLPNVIGTSCYNGSFGRYEGDLGTELKTITGDTISFDIYFVDSAFIPLLEMPIVEGRNIQGDGNKFYSQEKPVEIVLNRKAKEILGASVDSVIGHRLTFKVVGIAENCFSKSLLEQVAPVGFVAGPYNYSLMIRIKPENSRETIAQINAIASKITDDETLTVQFYDELIALLYEKQNNFSTLVSIFSVLSIFISLIGVFGLVVFETQYRRKEIALRKINGATIQQVLELLNRKFLIITALSFVVATPLTWIGVHWWLEGFAYQTPIYWWVFLVAGLIVLGITIITVTAQSYKTATDNPVKFLKSE